MRKILVVFVILLLCGSAAGQSSETMSPEKSYQNLLIEEQNIKNEIQSVTASLSSLRGSKAKKAAQYLDQLVARQEAIQRVKLFYPESVKNNQQQSSIDEESREQVRRMVDEKVLARGGSLEESPISVQEGMGEQYWSVVLSISTNPDISKYRSYGDVEVENMGGRYMFFLGRYATKAEADSKCKQIVKKGKFRDAFVVKRQK